ncbi:2-succinyl-5-enolpyruvyl-6-hydroxy-3-cyclohexene-1-carboxylic-acid synthase [Leuconostoc miyukkimchii]|uniref:2-succinyl-5-enolpyruvyl-6-hydroxy-3- cyclohexene-1-carboxylic-acid synthase n=1 Tax=Leuconostoc miyukkimchii TaxID=910540 RepID=UPI001C7DA0DC|nr:2-succinyl-5-enolpyruvyl-6-hydroxy-3-cyclohexene-1-carboxylic-acid synthase [Leuconostoc miyukkimchii]
MTINVLTKNTKHLLHALYQSGVRHFVISPGSRTTPVALLLAEYAQQNNNIKLYVDVDERSASFFALGIAKVLGEPVVILGTSGTAITEYTSAVAEASVSHIPLIILSTDRPSELQNNGAPQTLPQHQIFGNLAKNYITLTLQDAHPDITEYIDYMTQKLVHSANSGIRGPLQINLPLRKPLMPQLNDTTEITVKPLIFNELETTMSPITLSESRVVILAGPNEGEDYHLQLRNFAIENNVPVIADVLSRTRTQETIYGIDALVKANVLTESYKPDLVIRFCATPISASILQWLKDKNIPVWHVGIAAGSDHSRHVSRVFKILPAAFIAQLSLKNDASFYDLWQNLNNKKRKIIGEAAVSRTLDDILPENTAVFVANSMAIRDMDDVFTGKHTRHVYANRGANGIDGVVSTALGMASTLKDQRSVLLTGDLTLFHDMNGLMMARQYHLPIDIVVINNDGGAIFSFLPQAEAKEYFDMLFGTPLDLNMAKVADLYDLTYVKIDSADELLQTFKSSVNGPRLIEIKSDRLQNVSAHRELMDHNYE